MDTCFMERIIRQRCADGNLHWTQHFMQRIIQRGISLSNVEYALTNCQVIESYPDDYPYPSCLVLGVCIDQLPIHIVCGLGPDFLYLITAYYPDRNKWSQDLRTRLGKE